MTDERGTPEQFGEVTVLLGQLRTGDREAFDRVFPLVYAELRRIADRQLRGERSNHTLQPTALVNEAYVKLAGGAGMDYQDRVHFVAIAARAMRQILVDHARRRDAAKRGGGKANTTLDGKEIGFGDSDSDVELLALDAALDDLDEFDSRIRKVVEYRFFGGLTDSEIAEVLGITTRTVQRDWVKGRAWLYKELYGDRR
jgi:RNA polymerase sigma factor (TIGR02999 family)